MAIHLWQSGYKPSSEYDIGAYVRSVTSVKNARLELGSNRAF